MSEYNGSPNRRLRYRIAASVMDFFGVVACTVLIIALLAVLFNLFHWLQSDLAQTFSGLSQNVTDAVLID